MAWGPAPADATGLMRTVYDLRRKPIGTLEPGDIRVLLGQQEGVRVLVPRALALLEEEPLLDAGYYAGDLLAAVLRVPQSYWHANPDLRATVNRIIERVQSPDRTVKKAIEDFG
nr:contact-dependent growth inhibition system immunity protein [Kibdelosporangium sp. MJ126-NF4]